MSEQGQRVGEVAFLGKVKGVREWIIDRVEQLSGKSLISSAAMTSMSPNYTALFPHYF